MRRQHSLELVLFLLLFISSAYFHRTNSGWNANSRLALTFALVERHTTQIDDYWNRPGTETWDAAVYKGHYYSDKIIGVSLLGVPAYVLTRAVEDLLDASLTTEQKRYWVTILAIALPGALSAVLLFRLLLLYQIRFAGGETLTAPFLIAVSLHLGTLLFSYSTLFMSYLPAHAFFVAALYVFERWLARDGSRAARPNIAPVVTFACGLLCGFAVLCEYLYAITGGLFALYVLIKSRRRRNYVFFVLGAVLGVSPFLVYTYTIFGRPAVPYQYHMVPGFRAAMAEGLMGATKPRFSVLVLLSFHPFRGLFVHSPMLLLGVAGALAMLRDRRLRPLSLLILSSVVVVFLYNSAYYMWWGGWSFSPRHLAPALPLFAIGMVYGWRYAAVRWLFPLLVVPAIALHLIVTATDPQVPEPRNDKFLRRPSLTKRPYPIPFTSQVLPAFRHRRTDPNGGTWVGLSRGWPSLLPLMGAWLASGLISFALLKSKRPDECGTEGSAKVDSLISERKLE
ncbi:MAG: hypothetical protein ACR2IE_02350 [Candidatus Sumerlaeaceae bacterium]